MTRLMPGVSVRQHRVAAWAVGATLAIAGGVAFAYGTVGLPANQGFMPAFGSVTFFADAITALLLFSQARSSRDESLASLGVAYLFSALVIVPHLLAFPGVFAPQPLIGGSASAVWLWCVWHGGFALCVLRFAWHPAPVPGRGIAPAPVSVLPKVVGTMAVVALLSVVATAGLPFLPTILVGNSFARLNSLGIGPGVVLCHAAALVAVVVRLRARSVLTAWLAVAMVAATLDSVLTLYGAGRFTVGWYAARGLSLATGLIVLCVLLYELVALFGRVTERNRRLQVLSMTDGLTGLANRRAFDDALSVESRRSQREQTSLSLLMIDIDSFKGFNDRYGHPVGDECLRRIAQALQSEARRAGDVAARFGGEEFALLLPVTEEAGAVRVADLVHAAVARVAVPYEISVWGVVTVSIGIATVAHSQSSLDGTALVRSADEALYRAKQSGRNRSCGASTPRAADLAFFAEHRSGVLEKDVDR